jgi:membrane protease subunit HflK
VLPGGLGNRRWIAIEPGHLAGWVASGILVDPDQVGVVLRFGAYNELPPSPASTITCRARSRRWLTPSVTRVNRTEIGYRGAEGGIRGAVTRQVPEEALMLTGDENIVDINFTVFWVTRTPRLSLQHPAPDATVKSAAESDARSDRRNADRPSVGGAARQNRNRHP